MQEAGRKAAENVFDILQILREVASASSDGYRLGRLAHRESLMELAKQN